MRETGEYCPRVGYADAREDARVPGEGYIICDEVGDVRDFDASGGRGSSRDTEDAGWGDLKVSPRYSAHP